MLDWFRYGTAGSLLGAISTKSALQRDENVVSSTNVIHVFLYHYLVPNQTRFNRKMPYQLAR